MLDLALTGTLGLMGLASVPHCALMCGAPCAAAAGGHGRTSSVAGFQLGRVLGYAAAGAVAAASMGALREASLWSAALRPMWTLLHVALTFLRSHTSSTSMSPRPTTTTSTASAVPAARVSAETP